MVFARFRTRVGISKSAISPQILRHSFALRYLQAGGDPQGLQELMGYEGMTSIRQYLRWYDQLLVKQLQQGSQQSDGEGETRDAFEIQARWASASRNRIRTSPIQRGGPG